MQVTGPSKKIALVFGAFSTFFTHKFKETRCLESGELVYEKPLKPFVIKMHTCMARKMF